MRDLIPDKVRRKRRPKVKVLPSLAVAREVFKKSVNLETVTMTLEEGDGRE
jgi:hypothetical protein